MRQKGPNYESNCSKLSSCGVFGTVLTQKKASRGTRHVQISFPIFEMKFSRKKYHVLVKNNCNIIRATSWLLIRGDMSKLRGFVTLK